MSDFTQRQTVDCTRCQTCKVTEADEPLYLTPNNFRWQYAYCLTHYEEKLGEYPPGYYDPLLYEPDDLDA